MKFHKDKTGELPLCRMGGAENEAVSHIASKYKILAQTKRGMKMYADIFIGDYAKNNNVMKHHCVMNLGNHWGNKL